MAVAAFEQFMLFPLNLGMLLERGSLIRKPQPEALLFCGDGCVFLLSSREEPEKAGPWLALQYFLEAVRQVT